MPSVVKISRLFIANRGEICRRIALTAQRMGIETVAITDRTSPPAFLTDLITTFVQVPEETPALYLDMIQMVSLATDSGCDAVHPGFGFLSENSDFAALCIKNGLTWVGPTPESIHGMASKSNARDIAKKANVPCIEGLQGIDLTTNEDAGLKTLHEFARKTGYPLLVKAAFGGGGKGMRLVYQESELKENALRASSEARNSFGNPEVIVERYLESPRHIEVQILADKHGNVAAIGDRDCSLQRRHQKIIEEAPAPGLLPEIRQQLHEAAINLAKTVRYDNAGTVEFLLDDKTDGQGKGSQKFYFLEMNTRLQVEHPVSEEVFGIDLVEWQLRIASGSIMPEGFKKLEPRGHSIEARMYAEQVENDYFPAPGPVRAFIPAGGPGIRWEVGIDTVDEVSTRFDPMVAKLVVTASTRLGAMDRMVDALNRSFFAAKHTNRDLIVWLVGSSKFRERALTTHFLKDDLPQFKIENAACLQAGAAKSEALLEALCSGELLSYDATNSGADGLKGIPTIQTTTTSAFRPSQTIHTKSKSPSIGTTITESGMWNNPAIKDGYSIIGRGYLTDQHAKISPFWYAACNSAGKKEFWVSLSGRHYCRILEKKQSSSGDGALVTHELLAPVPGKVVAIKAKANEDVALGEAIVVLESMKMEFEVKASRSGTIAEVKVKVGEQVAAGQVLAHWAD